MTAVDHLMLPWDELITRRRSLVAALHEVVCNQLAGDSIGCIQRGIETGKLAIEDGEVGGWRSPRGIAP
jgi:hypothetical protein